MICPRCGLPGTISIEKRGKREYIYYIHTVERKRIKHYVGPAGQYRHVERLHNLSLKNLQEINYIDVVLRALNRYIEYRRKRQGEEGVQELVEGLKRVEEFCRRKIIELEFNESKPYHSSAF